jgi:hypothetical protein
LSIIVRELPPSTIPSDVTCGGPLTAVGSVLTTISQRGASAMRITSICAFLFV